MGELERTAVRGASGVGEPAASAAHAACGEPAGAALREAYGRLQTFARDTAGVRVAPRSLSVAREVRPAFYGLVEEVQRACVLEAVGEAGLERARRVAALCAAARAGLVAATNLSTYKLPDLLEHLLADPAGAAAEPAFGLVLDALQQGVPADGLAARAREGLGGPLDQLVRCAYEQWAYLGVVRALEPVRFWGVWSDDTVEVHAFATDAVEVGVQASSPEHRMPEAVFQTRDGRVFGMRTEAARELDFYGVKIVRRRDHSAAGNTANLLGHRALLLYRLPGVEAVGITADREKNTVVPPDLVCEVLTPAEMAVAAHVSAFVARINVLRARRPVQVLTYGEEGSFPEGMLDDPGVARVERTVVRCDEAALASVAAKLA